MTLEEEKRIVYIAGALGYMMQEENFKDVYGNREISAIVQNLEKLLTKVSTEGFEKVYRKVQKGDLQVVVVNNQELEDGKRKMLETQVAVNRGNLYTIAEHAMAECKNCTRLRSKCSLRVALVKSKIPGANDGKGKCEYNWEVE